MGSGLGVRSLGMRSWVGVLGWFFSAEGAFSARGAPAAATRRRRPQRAHRRTMGLLHTGRWGPLHATEPGCALCSGCGCCGDAPTAAAGSAPRAVRLLVGSALLRVRSLLGVRLLRRRADAGRRERTANSWGCFNHGIGGAFSARGAPAAATRRRRPQGAHPRTAGLCSASHRACAASCVRTRGAFSARGAPAAATRRRRPPTAHRRTAGSVGCFPRSVRRFRRPDRGCVLCSGCACCGDAPTPAPRAHRQRVQLLHRMLGLVRLATGQRQVDDTPVRHARTRRWLSTPAKPSTFWEPLACAASKTGVLR